MAICGAFRSCWEGWVGQREKCRSLGIWAHFLRRRSSHTLRFPLHIENMAAVCVKAQQWGTRSPSGVGTDTDGGFELRAPKGMTWTKSRVSATRLHEGNVRRIWYCSGKLPFTHCFTVFGSEKETGGQNAKQVMPIKMLVEVPCKDVVDGLEILGAVQCHCVHFHLQGLASASEKTVKDTIGT